MKPNEFFNTLKFCCEEERFAILKAIEFNKRITYKSLKKYVGDARKSSHFAYHLRKLKKYKAIMKNEGNEYLLTERGEKAVSLIEGTLTEKYIAQDDLMCLNTDDNNHQLIQICRRCGYIKNGEAK